MLAVIPSTPWAMTLLEWQAEFEERCPSRVQSRGWDATLGQEGGALTPSNRVKMLP